MQRIDLRSCTKESIVMEAKKNYGHIFGVILNEVKEFRTASFLTPCFMILEVIVETLIPLLMASIVDNGVQKGDMRHILIIGTCMLGLAIAGLFTGVMGGYFGAMASTGLARNLRKSMFRNIQTYSFSNIDKFSTSFRMRTR